MMAVNTLNMVGRGNKSDVSKVHPVQHHARELQAFGANETDWGWLLSRLLQRAASCVGASILCLNPWIDRLVGKQHNHDF